MHLFDFYSIDRTYLSKILMSKRIQEIVYVIAQYIVSTMDDRYFEHWYRYTQDWKKKFLSMKESERIDLVLNTGFGPISLCEDPEKYIDTKDYENVKIDYDQHLLLLNPKFKDKGRLEHYIWYHECEHIVFFTLELCRLLWPNKKFHIVSTPIHTFVMEDGDYDTIYDHMWSFFHNPVSDDILLMSKAKEYDDVMSYISDIFHLSDERNHWNHIEAEPFIKFYDLVPLKKG